MTLASALAVIEVLTLPPPTLGPVAYDRLRAALAGGAAVDLALDALHGDGRSLIVVGASAVSDFPRRDAGEHRFDWRFRQESVQEAWEALVAQDVLSSDLTCSFVDPRCRLCGGRGCVDASPYPCDCCGWSSYRCDCVRDFPGTIGELALFASLSPAMIRYAEELGKLWAGAEGYGEDVVWRPYGDPFPFVSDKPRTDVTDALEASGVTPVDCHDMGVTLGFPTRFNLDPSSPTPGDVL